MFLTERERDLGRGRLSRGFHAPGASPRDRHPLFPRVGRSLARHGGAKGPEAGDGLAEVPVPALAEEGHPGHQPPGRRHPVCGGASHCSPRDGQLFRECPTYTFHDWAVAILRKGTKCLGRRPSTDPADRGLTVQSLVAGPRPGK